MIQLDEAIRRFKYLITTIFTVDDIELKSFGLRC